MIIIMIFTFFGIADVRRRRTRKIKTAAFGFAFSQAHADFYLGGVMNIFFVFKNHAAGGNIAIRALNHFNQIQVDFGVYIQPVTLKINHNVIFITIRVNLAESRGNTVGSAGQRCIGQNCPGTEFFSFIHQNLVTGRNHHITGNNRPHVLIYALQNAFSVNIQ